MLQGYFRLGNGLEASADRMQEALEAYGKGLAIDPTNKEFARKVSELSPSSEPAIAVWDLASRTHESYAKTSAEEGWPCPPPCVPGVGSDGSLSYRIWEYLRLSEHLTSPSSDLDAMMAQTSSHEYSKQILKACLETKRATGGEGKMLQIGPGLGLGAVLGARSGLHATVCEPRMMQSQLVAALACRNQVLIIAHMSIYGNNH